MVANANARWEDSVGAFQDALQVQAGVVGNIEGARTTMYSLVSASQSATGALQATQATATTRKPAITAEAGLVPWADWGIKQILR